MFVTMCECEGPTLGSSDGDVKFNLAAGWKGPEGGAQSEKWWLGEAIDMPVGQL